MRTKIRVATVLGCVAAVVIATDPTAVDARVRTRGTVKKVAAFARSVPTTAVPITVPAPTASVAAANLPSPASVGQGGVGGTGFRRVSDYLRDASTNARRGAAASVDPALAAVADDASAFVDTDGRLLYIDQFGDAPVEAADAAPPPEISSSGPEVAAGVYLPPDNTFGLHSRPGSTKTIFLDFDGYTVSGTAWNDATGVFSRAVPPYDFDGIAGRSATDELYIRGIWQAVADDYAAFDVDVTTQQPSDDALYRSSIGDNTYGSVAVITPDKWMPTVCGGGCGGVAYVGIFGDSRTASGTALTVDRYYGPAWAFASSGGSWTYVADTISHEVGHNLGLSHDGLANTGVAPCTTSATYFSGNGSGVGSWAPIMGSPNNRQYSQWSRGEYACANQFQDDVALIGARTGVVSDESSFPGNAVPIPTSELPTADQVIGFAGDVDYFAINVTTGYLRAILTRTVNATSLLPRFAILNSSGTELTSGFLSSSVSGYLELSSLPVGTYYVSVTGAGFSTPQAGFSNYASFGFYNVSAQTIATPNPPASVLANANGSQQLLVSWSASASLSSLAPTTYAASLCNAITAVCGAPVDTTSTALSLSAPTPTGSYYAKVNARHIAGRVSADATSSSAAVLTAPVAPAPIRLVFNESTDTVTVVWGGGQEFAPVAVTGRTLTVVNRLTGLPIFTQSVAASGSLSFATALAEVWLDASLISQTAYSSPWNTSLPSPIGSVFLGRIAAPQTPGTTVPGRPSAPQTPGTTIPGRPSAPQV